MAMVSHNGNIQYCAQSAFHPAMVDNAFFGHAPAVNALT